MFSAIGGWVEEKATGYLKTGIQAGGSLAGNAVGGVGGLVESAGKSGADSKFDIQIWNLTALPCRSRLTCIVSQR